MPRRSTFTRQEAELRAASYARVGHEPSLRFETDLYAFHLYEYPDWHDQGARAAGARRWTVLVHEPGPRARVVSGAEFQSHAKALAHMMSEMQRAILALEAQHAPQARVVRTQTGDVALLAPEA